MTNTDNKKLLPSEAVYLLEDFTEDEILEFADKLYDLPRNTVEWSRRRYIAYLASQGLSRTAIAEQVGLDQLTIKRYLQSPWLIKLIAKLQDNAQVDATATAERIKTKFLQAADEAADKMIDTMNVSLPDDPTSQAKIQYQASRDILLVAGVISDSKKQAEREGGPTALVNKLVLSLNGGNQQAIDAEFSDSSSSDSNKSTTKKITESNSGGDSLEKETERGEVTVASGTSAV